MATPREAAGRGVWLGASHVLGRPVPFEENPHVCGNSLTGTMTGRSVRLTWRDCAACAVKQATPDRSEPQP
ncbi:hypothetical protein ABZ671_18755 [Micromonospora sp. NPDC006766]|uniref:hypothetical protein n=1 Tax=Micromonospora sp. NPDC006766 TaxID=3154778 RepID=UPI0033F3E328